MSKVISESDGDTVARWELPVVEGAGNAGPGAGVTVEAIEQIQKQAYDEGFARGHREGLALGQAKIAQLDKLMSMLNEPFAELDQEVEQELLVLAKAIARQLVRRELKTDPGQVVAVVREAMAALPVAARSARLHLHPEDAALVREVLSLEQTEGSWHVTEDPLLARGDCRVTTNNSQIDASLESRLTALITSVLGGDRGHDNAPGA
jgi:flagellar assembly protein FliH